MIGILDVAERGLVYAALEGSGHGIVRVSSYPAALRGVAHGELDALVIETTDPDPTLRALCGEARVCSSRRAPRRSARRAA